MLWAGLARAEKVAEFDRAHLATGGRIGLVQDERATIVVSAEQPPVTIFTVIDFSLGHLARPRFPSALASCVPGRMASPGGFGGSACPGLQADLVVQLRPDDEGSRL